MYNVRWKEVTYFIYLFQSASQKKKLRKQNAAKAKQEHPEEASSSSSQPAASLPLLDYTVKPGQQIPQTNPPTIPLAQMYPKGRYPPGKQDKHPDELYVLIYFYIQLD